MSANAELGTAVSALKMGACDYITKRSTSRCSHHHPERPPKKEIERQLLDYRINLERKVKEQTDLIIDVRAVHRCPHQGPRGEGFLHPRPLQRVTIYSVAIARKWGCRRRGSRCCGGPRLLQQPERLRRPLWLPLAILSVAQPAAPPHGSTRSRPHQRGERRVRPRLPAAARRRGRLLALFPAGAYGSAWRATTACAGSSQRPSCEVRGASGGARSAEVEGRVRRGGEVGAPATSGRARRRAAVAAARPPPPP